MVAFTITPSRAAVRLNSGVRRRQTKIFSTWGSPAWPHRNSQCPSATYSVQLESSCTPSVVAHSQEKLASAQNQFCAAGLNSFDWTQVRQVSQAKASLVSRLTIRSSRVRFAASAIGRYDSATCRGRCAARLNSGVRPGQKKSPVNKRQAKLACRLPSPSSGL